MASGYCRLYLRFAYKNKEEKADGHEIRRLFSLKNFLKNLSSHKTNDVTIVYEKIDIAFY